MAEGGVWGWGKELHTWYSIPRFRWCCSTDRTETRKMILELADGFMAHYKPGQDGKPSLHTEVNFKSDEDKPTGMRPWFILWAAYRWTGDPKYVKPFVDAPLESLALINNDALDMLNLRKTATAPLMLAAKDRTVSTKQRWQLAWQANGDTSYLNKVYASQIETAHNREFINTQGSLWIDRVYFNNGELQRSRLGGVALMRNYCYPGNAVSWRFEKPANDQSVAILVPEATPDHVNIIAYNLDSVPVKAQMTGWEIDPGQWTISQGTVQGSGDAMPAADSQLHNSNTQTVAFERSKRCGVYVCAAHDHGDRSESEDKRRAVLVAARPRHRSRRCEGRRQKMTVTVHSVGAVDAPVSKVVVHGQRWQDDCDGHVPALKAPVDLTPKTAQVSIAIPAGADLKGATVSRGMRRENSGNHDDE